MSSPATSSLSVITDHHGTVSFPGVRPSPTDRRVSDTEFQTNQVKRRLARRCPSHDENFEVIPSISHEYRISNEID